MSAKSFLSIHATERLRERTKLQDEEFLSLMDSSIPIPLGEEEGKTHYLFFSPPDDLCFVAVKDPKNGEIITILPLDYHKWEISLEPQQETKAQTLDFFGHHDVENHTSKMYNVFAYFEVEGAVKNTKLCAFPCYQPLKEFSKRTDVAKKVCEKIVEKEKEGWIFNTCFIRRGKSGKIFPYAPKEFDDELSGNSRI